MTTTEEKTIWNSDGTDGPCLICPPPEPVKAEPPKWRSEAGPIQQKKVQTVLNAIRQQHQTFKELTGVVGVDEHEFCYFSPFGGGNREDVTAAWTALGEKFGWLVTRENYQQIVSEATAALQVLATNLPIKDNRRTVEQETERQMEADKRNNQAERRRVMAEMNGHSPARPNLPEQWADGTCPEFRADIKAIAAKAQKPVCFVFDLWQSYYEKCGDQSAILSEFEQWYKMYLTPPPAVEQPATSAAGVTVKRNIAKNGVEIWFDGKPTEEKLAECRSKGFRPSKRGGWHWYKKFGSYAWAQAHTIAGLPLPGETDPSAKQESGQEDDMQTEAQAYNEQAAIARKMFPSEAKAIEDRFDMAYEDQCQRATGA